MRSCYRTVDGGKVKELIALNLGQLLGDLHLFWKKKKSATRCNFGFVMELHNCFKITVIYAYWSEIINKQKTCEVVCDRYFFQVYTSKDQAVDDERKRCGNSFGSYDNSEIRWNIVGRSLDVKWKQRWEAQTRATDSKWLHLLLCTKERWKLEGEHW